MQGLIIYHRDDVEKNRRFIQIVQETLREYHISLRLIVLQGQDDIPQMFLDCHADFVINRSRNAELTRYFENKGVRVFNRELVTRITNDKERTYQELDGIVPYMPYLLSIEALLREEQMRFPYVVKARDGHGGEQVYMVNNIEETKQAINALNGTPYIIQKCCSDVGKDLRVYIIGNSIVMAMLRTSRNSFKSNYSLGGEATAYTLNENEREMVARILEKIPLDYGGIDFIFHNGKAVFNEIEDAVGAKMVYENTELDIIKEFAEYVYQTISGKEK